MCGDMICSYCVALFQNAALPPYYRPPGDGQGELLRPGSLGVERGVELLSGIGGYVETYTGQRLKTIYAATMIDGSAVCLVHAFDVLQTRRRA